MPWAIDFNSLSFNLLITIKGIAPMSKDWGEE